MSEPPSSPTQTTRSPDRGDLAAAALARLTSNHPSHDDEVRWAKEREKRQHFRRLVDPGIVRGNNEETANACVECLLTLCQNILDHPEEEKYRKFKTTNKRIQACIIRPKGGLQYAVEVGFREHVEDFQPYYQWRPTPEHADLLRIGTFVLKEHHEKVVAKAKLAGQSKMTRQQEQEEVARRVKLAYEDDRSRVAERARIEHQQRIAQEAGAASALAVSPPTSPSAGKIRHADDDSLKED